MENATYVDRLLGLVEKATSPFHTVEAVKKALVEDGFEELQFAQLWDLKKGGKYVVSCYGTSIFGFTIGKEFAAEDGFRVAAAHSDFPGFRIKSNPEMKAEGYVQLNVETYGGVNLASWLDRGLSVAGRVILKSEDIFHPEVRLVDFRRPILAIPNIAVHLNKELNKGVELNKQTEMLPIAAMDDGSEHCFLECLAKELGVEVSDILDYELNVYNADQGERIGLHEEFLSAPRLDNLASVQALVDGMLEGKRDKGLNLIAVFDHEEVGSRSKQGAASVVLPQLLEKIYVALGLSEREYKNAMTNSMFASVDVSHGFHPSYGVKYDPTNKNILNKGFSIKEACAQSYATDSEAIAIVQQICEKEGIAYQKFLNRSDIAGGGTLGAIASAVLPVRTVDMGVPIFAMHSSREMMGVKDQESMSRFVKAYFTL